MSRYEQANYLVTFTSGRSRVVYGSARTHNGVLYIEEYGGIGGGDVQRQTAFPLTSVESYEKTP